MDPRGPFARVTDAFRLGASDLQSYRGTGDDLDEVTEKEILLEIFREVRWIGRYLAVLGILTILAIGGAGLVVVYVSLN